MEDIIGERRGGHRGEGERNEQGAHAGIVVPSGGARGPDHGVVTHLCPSYAPLSDRGIADRISPV